MHDVATHDDSKGQYFWVWGALLVLTGVEVWLGYRQIFEPVRMLEVLLVLSVIKSALIIGYFMHLKFEKAGDALDAGDLGGGLLCDYVYVLLSRRGPHSASGCEVGR